MLDPNVANCVYGVAGKMDAAIYRTFFHVRSADVRLHQQALHLFFKKGHFERHMRRMRTLYRRKHDCLYQNIHDCLPQVRIIGKNAGLHFLLELDPCYKEEEWLEKARLHGERLYPTSHYYVNQPLGKKPVLLMEYGGVPMEHIPDAVNRLVQAWK